MHTDSRRSSLLPIRIDSPTSKTIDSFRSPSILQLPLKSADLGLSLLVSLLPDREKEIQPVTAVAIDRASPSVAFDQPIGLDCIAVKLEALQLVFLALCSLFNVGVALFNLLFELSMLSVPCRNLYLEEPYQIDRDLDSILGRLVKFVDSSLHFLANLDHCLLGQLDLVSGSCI
jgi:hypothetical protein